MNTTKLHLYAVEYEQEWHIDVSLDLRVDLLWWTANNRKERGIRRIWLIAADRPAGWALQHRQIVKSHPHAMSSLLWGAEQGYTEQGQNLLAMYHSGDMDGNIMDSSTKRQLVCGAISITGLLNGRSLLLPEFQNIMEDRQSPYLDSWRSCLQLAYLQKQIRILSAVYTEEQITIQPSFVERLQQHLFTVSGQSHSLQHHSSRCRRCNSTKIVYTPCASCGSSSCGYCEECLTMGRSRECGILLQAVRPPIANRNTISHSTERFTNVSRETVQQLQQHWRLSLPQAQAAGKAILFLQDQLKIVPEAFVYQKIMSIKSRYSALHNRLAISSNHKQIKYSQTKTIIEQPSINCQSRFLMWAVTGAGKTEMTFPLVDYMLQQQGRVLIATPRRDVVLELAPRISRAFPAHTVTVLYGGSEQRWQEGQIVIATTHQLLRYGAAFELVIIDEIDAFPYEGNPMLQYAASQVCLPHGKFVYLSATPSHELQKQIQRGLLAHAKVPARFHGHPLPVPDWLRMAPFSYWRKKKSIPQTLIIKLRYSIERDAQIFWFVPRIDWIPDMVALIQHHFPHIIVAGTSSQDEDRAEKVTAFRDRHIRLLVTTTILERGVTVPQSDVYIIEANHSVYRTAALIQMAGRAGRSQDDPAGKVVFAATERTGSQQEAIRQIRLMNKVARKEGYIQ